MTAATTPRFGSPEDEGASGKEGGRRRRRAIAILVAGGVVISTIGVGAGLGGVRLNLTPSEPLGLWRVASLDRPLALGDLVFVCPSPGPLSDFGLERGYFRSGSCPGGAAPLIKSIVAMAGARIEIGSGVSIDGATLPHSRLSPRDGEGRSLSPWPGGLVPPGQIFLHSRFAGSYDSRYFGPVPEAGLLGLALPLITYDP